MTLEPALHPGCLVRPIIIKDDVDLDTRLLRDVGVDLVEELEELVLPVAAVAHVWGEIELGEPRVTRISSVFPGLARAAPRISRKA